jgi:hypothetical protein
VYYFPGRDEHVNAAGGGGGGDANVAKNYETDLFANVFCHSHAIELVGKAKGATKLRYPSHLVSTVETQATSKIRNGSSSSEAAPEQRVIPKRRHVEDVNPDLKRPRHQKSWTR